MATTAIQCSVLFLGKNCHHFDYFLGCFLLCKHVGLGSRVPGHHKSLVKEKQGLVSDQAWNPAAAPAASLSPQPGSGSSSWKWISCWWWQLQLSPAVGLPRWRCWNRQQHVATFCRTPPSSPHADEKFQCPGQAGSCYGSCFGRSWQLASHEPAASSHASPRRAAATATQLPNCSP